MKEQDYYHFSDVKLGPAEPNLKEALIKKLVDLLTISAPICTVSNANVATIAVGSSIDLTDYLTATGGHNLSTATTLDLLSSSGGTSTPGVAGIIPDYGTGTGSFASFSCMTGTYRSIQDIESFRVGARLIVNFFMLSRGNNISPINFDLSSIDTIGSIVGNTLAFAASGMLRYDGFDATHASFVFTSLGNMTTSFSTTAFTTVVPEPATWALMILGMSAVGFDMRRRNTTTRVRFA